ncbi:MAG: hypothetical protein JO069_13530 [Verrucomicrobia bacterium]|nr:hypothetical protein [Verrucomicrobiota bacterium]
MYISDDPKADHRLNLELRNTADQAIMWEKRGDVASEKNHHFELVFRSGVLSDKTLKKLLENKAEIIPKDGSWDVFSAGEDSRSGSVSLYLLYKETNQDTTRVFVPGQRLTVPLRNISANAGAGERGTRVELKLNRLTYVDETTPITGSRIQHLQIISHLGSRRVPLHVGFVGSNRILNDGSSANTLVLQLMNVLKSEGDTSVRLTTDSTFLISFDVQSSKEVAPWSLCTEEEAKELRANDSIMVAKTDASGKVEVRDGKPVSDTGRWQVTRTDHGQGESPEWSILPKQEIVLKRDDFILIYISCIKTSLPSGLTNLYLEYKNIPGFWGGQVVCAIEKAPLLFHDAKDQGGLYTGELRVGIGSVNPGAKLEIATGPKEANTKPLVIRKDNEICLMVGDTGVLHVGPGSSTIAPDLANAIFASQGPEAGIAVAQNSGVLLWLYASTAGGCLGTISNHQLVLKTNNENRAVVTADGKVHIGSGSSSIGTDRVNAVVASQSPDAGIAIAQRDGVNVLLQASGAGGYIGTTSNHPLVLRTGDADRVVVDADGKVGIGTRSRGATLSIMGGLHVGGDSDPGDKNLLVGGKASVKGGLYVGPTVEGLENGLSADNQLVVNGACILFGSLIARDSIGLLHKQTKNVAAEIEIAVEPALVFKTHDDRKWHNRVTIHPPGGTAPTLDVAGPISERLDVIKCNGRTDWEAGNHPIKKYFSYRLRGKPPGTMLRVIPDHPAWRGHYWKGWVDADGTIRVIHNHANTQEIAPDPPAGDPEPVVVWADR